MNKLTTFAMIGILGFGALAATGAEAQHRRFGGYSGGFSGYHGGHSWGGYRRGGGVAAGAIFGLATGALLAGAATAPWYGSYGPPVYYARPPRVVTYSAYPYTYGGYPEGGYFGGGYYGGGYAGGSYYGGGYPGYGRGGINN